MPQATTAPPLAWSRAFPAVPAQVAEARRFLAAILDGRPTADDAVLCLSELATNAVIHSHSGQPGGSYTVSAELGPRRLRVEVRDQGGPWTPAEDPDDPHGRGLLIVRQLAADWGRAGGVTGWTVWFEMDCSWPAAEGAPPHDRHHAAELGPGRPLSRPGPDLP
jgi:serine/threonine-protein kinase RsbW